MLPFTKKTSEEFENALNEGLIKCPKCKQGIIKETKIAFSCSDWANCSFHIIHGKDNERGLSYELFQDLLILWDIHSPK
jgi:hypothetical protein